MAGSEYDRHAANESSAIEETIAVFGQAYDFYVRRKAILLNASFDKLSAGPRMLDIGCSVLDGLLDAVPLGAPYMMSGTRGAT